MSKVKPDQFGFDGQTPQPPPAHSGPHIPAKRQPDFRIRSLCRDDASKRWRRSDKTECFRDDGLSYLPWHPSHLQDNGSGFHQPVSAMLSPGSPFRTGSGHRAPWPPPADNLGRYGGLYSLFPGEGGAIYSQSSSTTRFAHSTNTYHSFIGTHKTSDSLFSSNYSFGGPTPPPAPPFSPGAGGISRLELLAKGFNNNNNTIIINNNTACNNNSGIGNGNAGNGVKKSSSRDCKQQRRWEPQPPPAAPVVKTEVTARSSCACRNTPGSPSPAPNMDSKKGAGCSRTTPMEWPLAIKKEPGAAPAACQAALANSAAIPVGIAVARQRLQDHGKPPPVPQKPPPEQHTALAVLQAPQGAVPSVQPPPAGGVASQQDDRALTNGVAPWAHGSALWQYPAHVPVHLGPTDHLPLPPVGYQLVRDHINGNFLLIPTTNIEHLQRAVLWPSYPAATLQPTTQHIQLLESGDVGEFQTQRLVVQPQLTLTATTPTAAPAEPSPPKPRKTVIKVEAPDCDSKSRSTEVTTVAASATPVNVTHFFYEHPTAVVQLSQTPQPSACIQTDNGKRSQATSPVNPAETCLTPPPEAVPVQTENEDNGVSVTSASEANMTIQVQDASNQTDTPPASEDENLDQHASSTTPTAMPMVDLSGLELLSNSIEQFENHRKSVDIQHEENSNALIKVFNEEQNQNHSSNLSSSQQAVKKQDNKCADEKAAETLQMLCQTAHIKLEHTDEMILSNENLLDRSADCDKPTSSVSGPIELKSESVRSDEDIVKENSSSDNLNLPEVSLGGLRLLCALAEQRIKEEGGITENASNSDQRLVSTCSSQQSSDSSQRLSTESAANGNNDLSRSYKTRKSERECKKFIASKTLHCYQSGNLSSPGSPQHSYSGRMSPSATDMLNQNELDMRMKLAELQRKYREQQQQLSKLTPKRPGSDLSSVETSSTGSLSPVKRGPGRPRKKCNKMCQGVDSPPMSPPTSSHQNKQRITRPLPSKNKEISPAKELPPPVLEKVTDLNTKSRSRLDGDDVVAPKLKASKYDILKPPTLTANKLSSFPKLKSFSTGANNKGLKSTNCNGNTSKGLDGSSVDSDKIEPLGLHSVKSTGITIAKDSTLISEKPSAFSLCRLSLANTTSHTFGSKPPPHLPSSGESDHLWFRSLDKTQPILKAKDADSPKFEALETPPSLPLSSSKKRKVGRPKKHLSDEEPSTETIVAKKPKASFLLSQPRYGGLFSTPKPLAVLESSPFAPALKVATDHKPKILPKLKAEAKVKTWWRDDDDAVTAEWQEQNKISEKGKEVWKKNIDKKLDKAQLKSSSEVTKGRKRKLSPVSSKSSPVKKTASIPLAVKRLGSQERKKPKANTVAGAVSKDECKEIKNNETLVTDTKNTVSCQLTQSHLNKEKQRALIVMGGLFYAGNLSAIQPPDVYGITLDGERGNRPQIFSQEEVLRDAILEVRPPDISSVPPGTRVCAYWSQQYRCLYPGTVAQPSTPDPELDSQFVSVEFDDGDSGRINLDDVRLLPANYPILEYDRNPLQSLGKRRRRNSAASSESHSKDRRTSSEAPSLNNNNNNNNNDITLNNNTKKLDSTSSKQEPISSEVTVTTKVPSGDGIEHTGTGQKPGSKESDRLRERKRLKKRRREKLRRLGILQGLKGEELAKRKRKKHRSCDDHCRHKRRHKRHRRHRHRRSKESSSSSESKSGHTSGDAMSRLSPVLEQLDILEIQQSAIREAKDKQESASDSSPTTGKTSSTCSEVEDEVADICQSKDKKEVGKPKKCRDRQTSVESRSKIAAFLPARQLWGWSGRGFKRPGAKGRGKKEFFKAIQRGKETICVGDCAVFLSTGRPDRPYIGRIESMWEAWGTNMVVRVKWFYHPEETNGCTVQLKYPGALFESPHVDENDVQTISHKCEVLPLKQYTETMRNEPHRYSTIYDNNDIYYLAGYYDPTTNQLTMQPGVV